ncbi:dentin matrix acidic phosphoprotein 1 isoform X2 [Hemicordylus capensis]|uniref:dentin matrix acidic phosphoprotein 1 isoform X2 n=1 Tax=Hemicordylus capensis TaxID=884348 RepID=UPI0023031E56|nr:dentin matrix acidic phosphoprotein 1 isoform X2 [Hemicordylus capensis]
MPQVQRDTRPKMKRSAFLLISLWALTCARPAYRHHSAHHRTSEEHWATANKESLNEVADSTDLSNEDTGSRLSISTESREDSGVSEHDSSSHENSEENRFIRKLSSSSLESHSADEWITRDNDDAGYFRIHQVVHGKWADDKDFHDYYGAKEAHGDGSDDQSLERVPLEDQNEIHGTDSTDNEKHAHGDIKQSKDQLDVENDGMLYIPEQVLYTFTGTGGNELANDEDVSGDGNHEGGINGKDPGHTVPPNKGDTLLPSVTNGEQGGGNAIGRHQRDSSSSSSSSSESSNMDKEDNHIIDHGKRHGGDSYSSSQEDRYDFDDEGMQGDDPHISKNDDSDSSMIHGDGHLKESSQEASREIAGKKVKHHSKSVEHFARKVYHYVDDGSDEDHSPEHDESKSLQEDDAESKEDSQSVEDISQSTENVLSRSREHANSHSKESAESSSRKHSHSQSREDVHSQSREDVHSRSREDVHSRSREDVHSQSREDLHSQSREDLHSQSREDLHSQSREDVHSQSREDVHSQSRELLASQSREDENSHSGEDDDTESVEGIKSESTEYSRTFHKKTVKKSKEIDDNSDEHSANKSEEQQSASRESKGQDSSSSEKSKSTEESEESEEDTDRSSHDDSKMSQSASSESHKVSQESAGSEDSNESDSSEHDLSSEQSQPSQSSETSESKESSPSTETDSQSREDTASKSDSIEDSWSRSMELKSQKLMLDIYHNKPLSDYDDNDCQDGY